VSTEAIGLAGVVLGAILGGAANLLLAWRRETVEAKSGLQVVTDVLDRAGETIDRVLEHDAWWWSRGMEPATQHWQPYRRALAERLPGTTLAKIERTMSRLDTLNAFARLEKQRAELAESRMVDARLALIEGQRQSQLKALEADELAATRRQIDDESNAELEEFLIKQAPTLEFSEDDRELLGQVRTQITDTRKLLTGVTWWSWHSRPALASIVTALAIGIGVGVYLGVRPAAFTSSTVAEILGDHRQGEALTSCEPVVDRGESWDCVVEFPARAGPCRSAASAPSAAVHRSVLVLVQASSCGSPARGVARQEGQSRQVRHRRAGAGRRDSRDERAAATVGEREPG
jgi:hypothetical protein